MTSLSSEIKKLIEVLYDSKIKKPKTLEYIAKVSSRLAPFDKEGRMTGICLWAIRELNAADRERLLENYDFGKIIEREVYESSYNKIPKMVIEFDHKPSEDNIEECITTAVMNISDISNKALHEIFDDDIQKEKHRILISSVYTDDEDHKTHLDRWREFLESVEQLKNKYVTKVEGMTTEEDIQKCQESFDEDYLALLDRYSDIREALS